MLFKRATMRYLTTFPKTKYVKLDQDGLYFELRNKFKGMTFLDLYEISKGIWKSVHAPESNKPTTPIWTMVLKTLEKCSCISVK